MTSRLWVGMLLLVLTTGCTQPTGTGTGSTNSPIEIVPSFVHIEQIIPLNTVGVFELIEIQKHTISVFGGKLGCEYPKGIINHTHLNAWTTDIFPSATIRTLDEASYAASEQVIERSKHSQLRNSPLAGFHVKEVTADQICAAITTIY